MNLQSLSDEKLDQQTFESVKAETESTLRVLHHLREVDRRKLFSRLKYKSLLDYTEKRLGYPYDQAWRRIEAMRLLKEVPEIEIKIADGTLNLTNIGYAQAAFKSEAKKESPLCREDKLKFLSQIENKSTRATQKLVAEKFGSETLVRETVKPVSAALSMLSVPVKDEFLAKLEALKGLLAHSHSISSTADLLEYAVSALLEKIKREKLGNKTFSAPRKTNDHHQAKDSRYVTAADRKKVWNAAHAECANCGSTYKLEIDHLIPFAKGGRSVAENLRLLCRNCNQRGAIEAYGLKKMSNYLKAPVRAYLSAH